MSPTFVVKKSAFQWLGTLALLSALVTPACNGNEDPTETTTDTGTDTDPSDSDGGDTITPGKPGIVVSPKDGLITTESGGTATFSLTLAAEPTADVTIALSSSNDKEGTADKASVTFTKANWNVAQTVTVKGVDDKDPDGDQKYSIITAAATSDDPLYAGMNADDVSVTNTDDETGGIKVAPTKGLKTTEAGGTANFAVVLTAEPSADVVIPLTSTNEKEGTIDKKSLTFTKLNWNAPQVVTVTGVDDKDRDGDVVYKVTLDKATSTDSKYSGFDADDVELTNTDDESPGFTIKPLKDLKTTESGGTATFTVVLNAKPTGDVTLPLSSDNEKEGTIDKKSLVFTAANFDAPQTVTITGVDDTLVDGDVKYKIVTGKPTSTDVGYAAIDPDDVEVTNIDNESAGITVTPTKGNTTEGGGTFAFTVTLNSKPTADVTINLSSSNEKEGTIKSGKVLVFTPTNFAAPQTVTIEGVDDDLTDGNQLYKIITAAAVSTDPAYSGLDAADVDLVNLDNETAGILANPRSGLKTTEKGDTATFTVVLLAKPTDTVIVPVSSSDLKEGKLTISSLEFTPANWNAPQVVTITGVDDDVADGDQPYTIVLGKATSKDVSYNGFDAADVDVINVDNDSPGVTVVAAADLRTTEAGGTAKFTVVLNSKPSGDVTVPLESSNIKEGSLAVTNLKFTAANWNAPQEVTVTGVDDKVADGNQKYTIKLLPTTSTDKTYIGIDPKDVDIINVDDDSPGITVTPTSVLNTTEGGGTATFTVVLNSQPTLDVSVNVTSLNVAEGVVNKPLLNFTALNWNAPQVVTVTGVNDDFADGNQPYIVRVGPTTSGDKGFNGLFGGDLAMTNIDNDTAGFIISAASGRTTESGGKATFTVRLQSRPRFGATVNIPVKSSNLGEGKLSITSLDFTDANWLTPQTVTVTGVDDVDPIVDGNQGYTIDFGPTVSAADPAYNAKTPASVAMINNDNDTAGIVLSKTAVTTKESLTASTTDTFTVTLQSKPVGTVTLAVTSNKSTTEASIFGGASLTFTGADWNTPQTVTVKGIDDLVADGDQPYTVTIAIVNATTTDAVYKSAGAALTKTVSGTNQDNDSAAVNFSKTSVSTGEVLMTSSTDTFEVWLNSQPVGDVTLAIKSSNTAEATVTTTLTFTGGVGGNWATHQIVTVTSVDDFDADGDQPYTITLKPTSTSTLDDVAYKSGTLTVAGINKDDEVPGIDVVWVTPGLSCEGSCYGDINLGETSTFTVALKAKPTVSVTVAVGTIMDLPGLGTVAPTPLTFTTANWNVPQTVTFTATSSDPGGCYPGTQFTFTSNAVSGPYKSLPAVTPSVYISLNVCSIG